MVDAYSPRVRRPAVHRRRPRRPLRPQGRPAARPADLPRPARCSPPCSARSEGVIIGRAVMGFGAAFVMPSTLSILTNVFPPDERTRAIAIWAGVSRRRRRHRPDRQRLPARALLVGLGVPRQRARHPRRADRRAHPAPQVERPRAGAGSTRSARCCRSPAWSRSCTPSSRRPATAGAAPRRLAWFAAAAVFIGGFVLVGAPQQAPDARPALVQGPALQRGVGRRSCSSSSPCSGCSS